VRIVAPAELPDELAALVSSEPPLPDVCRVCREYFLKYFSDRVLFHRWEEILAPRRGVAGGTEDAGKTA
jgi:hypothetical protein